MVLLLPTRQEVPEWLEDKQSYEIWLLESHWERQADILPVLRHGSSKDSGLLPWASSFGRSNGLGYAWVSTLWWSLGSSGYHQSSTTMFALVKPNSPRTFAWSLSGRNKCRERLPCAELSRRTRLTHTRGLKQNRKEKVPELDRAMRTSPPRRRYRMSIRASQAVLPLKLAASTMKADTQAPCFHVEPLHKQMSRSPPWLRTTSLASGSPLTSFLIPQMYQTKPNVSNFSELLLFMVNQTDTTSVPSYVGIFIARASLGASVLSSTLWVPNLVKFTVLKFYRGNWTLQWFRSNGVHITTLCSRIRELHRILWGGILSLWLLWQHELDNVSKPILRL